MFPSLARMKSLPQASRKSVPMSTIDRDCADACGGSCARRPDPAFAKSNRAKLPSTVNPLVDDEQRRLVRLWHESGEPSCTGIGPVIEVERIPLSLTQFDTIELHCWRNDWMVQRQGN